ncbi:MAG: hypothetical protein ACPGXK_06240 [Phycisphaerae bacterium]
MMADVLHPLRSTQGLFGRPNVQWIGAAVLCMLLVSSAGADQPTDAKETAPKPESVKPTAEGLLDAYVEAIGGREAWSKVQSRRISGIYELASRGRQFTMTVVEARPAKRHTLFVPESPQPPFEVGTNGKQAWTKFGYKPAVVQSDQERKMTVEFAQFDRYTDWRTHFPKVRYAGKEKVSGKLCHKVVMTPRIGFPETRFFDAETHLLIKADEVFAEGDTPQITIFDDYKKVDGVMYPHLLRIDFKGDLRHKIIAGIEHNVTLPPDEFKMPAYPDPRYPMEYQPDLDVPTPPGN